MNKNTYNRNLKCIICFALITILVIMVYEGCGVDEQWGWKDKFALIDKNIYDQIFEIALIDKKYIWTNIWNGKRFPKFYPH